MCFVCCDISPSKGDLPEPCDEERAPKVKVEFHYQTGDSSVRDYVVEELYPSYRSIEEIIDLEVVPIGETQVVRGDDGLYNLTCPNGQNECDGNKIHVSSHKRQMIDDLRHSDSNVEGLRLRVLLAQR